MCHENDLLEQQVQNPCFHLKLINIFKKKSLFSQIIQRVFSMYSCGNDLIEIVRDCEASYADNLEDL